MFIVYDKNMNKKEFPHGVWPLDIFIHSISKSRTAESVEGRSGIISKGQTHVNRPIEVTVGLKAHDTNNYRLSRDAAYAFFDDEEFYISEVYQKGKRYKVTVLQSYIPNRLNRVVAEMQFMLEMVELPFAESIGTTQDIQQNGINAEDGLWGFGMGLIADDDGLIYTHANKSRFKIYNAGNVPIHPFEQDFKIEMEMSQFAVTNSFFQLKNITNGSTFRINEQVMPNQKIILDGPNITSNGLNYLRKTNKGFIALEPGWNEFEVSGNTQATISFDFRFYYK